MRLEPKPATSLAASILYPLGALLATFVIAGLLVMAAGANPISVFGLVVKGAAGSLGLVAHGPGFRRVGRRAAHQGHACGTSAFFVERAWEHVRAV